MASKHVVCALEKCVSAPLISPLRIFSPIREVCGGAYSYRHTELSCLNDLDHKNQTTDPLFNKTNWYKFGQVHAEEPESFGMLRRVD
jgi:hypothetical protein